jgi:gliding motility-associated-like protein
MFFFLKNINKCFGIKSILMAMIIIISGKDVSAQLVVSTAMTPQQLVDSVLVGKGITVSNVKYTGAFDAIGSFSGGASTNIGMSNGIVMSTGMVDGNGSNGDNPIGSPASNFNSWIFSQTPSLDPQLYSIATDSIYDAAVLEFDFIPISDTVRFRYVFASEEYPSYVNSIYNDVFGFFISGQNPAGGNYTNTNIALIPGTTTQVSINNVNDGYSGFGPPTGPCKNCQYYVDNFFGTTIVYNGFTTVLTASCKVIPCTSYHIKLGVADVGDPSWDSAVFLDANSFSSDALKTTVTYTSNLDSTAAIEGCSSAIVSFILQSAATSPYAINYTVGGTAINGVDYPLIPTSDTIPAGQDSVGIVISPIIGGLPDSIKTVTITIQTSLCGNPQVYTIYIKHNSQLFATALGDTTICMGGQAILSANASGGSKPYSYSWSNGAGNTNPIVVSPTISTNYIITVTDACGVTATDSAMVYYATTNATISNDTTICPGGTAVLTAGGGIAYHWNNNVNTAINTVSPIRTTIYFVTVTDACEGKNSVTVFVNPPPNIITSASPDSICIGGSSTLSVTGGVSYLWSSNPVDSSLVGQQTLANPVVNPSVTTVYTVTGTDNLTCTNTSSVMVYIMPTPFAFFTINPNEICVAQNVNVLFTGTTGSDETFNWNFGDGIATGSGAGPYQVNWSTTGVKIITLQISIKGCPSAMYSDSVSVEPIVIADFNALDTSGCIPLTVFFHDSSKFENAHTIYLWNFGDGSTSTLQNPIHTYINAGTYSVIFSVSNDTNCTSSYTAPMLVNAYPTPIAAFAADPYTVSIFYPAVMFFNHSGGSPPPVSWLWNMGDGATSVDSSNFIHTYRDTGKYVVTLIDYNIYGCTDTAYKRITVRPDYSLYIPNSFTPNGDDLNPIFYAYGTGITLFDMKIFNRWGDLIFESNNIFTGWDGKFKGVPCPEGVYTYQVYYKEDQKEQHLLFGKITLIR